MSVRKVKWNISIFNAFACIETIGLRVLTIIVHTPKSFAVRSFTSITECFQYEMYQIGSDIWWFVSIYILLFFFILYQGCIFSQKDILSLLVTTWEHFVFTQLVWLLLFMNFIENKQTWSLLLPFVSLLMNLPFFDVFSITCHKVKLEQNEELKFDLYCQIWVHST